jgi:hypothetical protein
MGLMPRRTVWLCGVLAFAAVVAGGVYGLTAANTVPGTKAGDGQGAVTGYVVSSVHYGLNSTDPTKIDQATFNLDSTPAAGSTIKIKLVAAGTTWYSCSNVAAAVTCVTTSPQATVLSADELRVVVAN